MTPSTTPKNDVVAALPPQWVDDVDGVHEVLSDITRLMGILGSMHASRIGTVFGKDLDDMEAKIERLTNDITGKFMFIWHLMPCPHDSWRLFVCLFIIKRIR